MGWFEEQIKQRQLSDEKLFHETFSRIASSVTGDKSYRNDFDTSIQGASATEEVLRWFHVTPRTVPPNLTNFNEQIEYLTRPHGIMRRDVKLPSGWWKDAVGPMIGFLKENSVPVALLPNNFKGYHFTDPHTGESVQLNSETEKLLGEEGICFYWPFPLKEMTAIDLLKYIGKIRSFSDYLFMFVMMGVGALFGVLATKSSYLLMGKVLNSGNYRLLSGIAGFIIGLSVCTVVTSVVTSMIQQRIDVVRDIQVRAAVMMRILSLPPSFFKKYSSGELTSRSGYINQLVSMIYSMLYSAGMNSMFSLIYITQIFHYAPSLVLPALCIIAATIVLYIITSTAQIQTSRKRMDLAAKESGMSYSIISGIQKIRLSGSEKRAFSRWGNLYAKEIRYTYNPHWIIKNNTTLSSAIGLIGTLVIYNAAIKSHISYEEYYAFFSAYGMVYSAFLGITSMATQLAGIKPIIEMVDPILKEKPEISEGKEILTGVSGSIEVSNISFRYEPSMPYVLKNLSFKINPGQYIAIVGKSGCGKSTLVRLLLGFETPEKGAIYFDGRDISNVDMKSLRQRIGTVTQNGKLFSGSIYENIVISAPWLTMDDAWEAAEIAGLADDIRAMPMGMHTMIAEGSGGFSGGQKQRMMIARAIAPKPRILIFDEATSALDNITQKKVSDALDNLNCTRIVIAHRLSTIQHCDRIIVLDQGHIIEDGTYEELLEKKGFFAELVERQIVDEKE